MPNGNGPLDPLDKTRVDIKGMPVKELGAAIHHWGTMDPITYLTTMGGITSGDADAAPAMPTVAPPPPRTTDITPAAMAAQPPAPPGGRYVAPTPIETQPGPPMRAPLFGRIGRGLEEFGKGLGRVGEVTAEALGTAFAPSIMPVIPGTPQYKAATEARQRVQELAQSEMGLRAAEAEERIAQAEHERAEAAKAAEGDYAAQTFKALRAQGLTEPQAFEKMQQMMREKKEETPEQQMITAQRELAEAIKSGNPQRIDKAHSNVNAIQAGIDAFIKPPKGEDSPLGIAGMNRLNPILKGFEKYGVFVDPLTENSTHRDYMDVKGLIENQAQLAAAQGRADDSNAIRRDLANLSHEEFAWRKQEAEERDKERKDTAALKGREFIPAVQQSLTQQYAVNTGVRRLLEILDKKGPDGKPLKDSNMPFSELIPWIEYRSGIASAGEVDKNLSAINLNSLQQAGVVIRGLGGSRAKEIIDRVMQHTPDPKHDSLKNMYNKLVNIDQAQVEFFNAADKYGRRAETELAPELLTPYGTTPSPTPAPATGGPAPAPAAGAAAPGRAPTSAPAPAKIVTRALVEKAARERFGGNYAQAEKEFKQQGYTIRTIR